MIARNRKTIHYVQCVIRKDTKARYEADDRLESRKRPTALICFDDVIAMGVIQAFEIEGLKFPDALSPWKNLVVYFFPT
jgi:DNA-binding LacI/PurR family transcriptional regulator